MIADKYEIHEKIGQGNFGSIFLGENRFSKKKVAIKIEKEGSLRNESQVLEYLARNGCGSSIVQIFWYGVQDNYYILVMTYIEGISLQQYITGESKAQEKIRWFLAAIKILEKIHSAGVIHRDIKPAHFLFWKDTWYLIDFGFSTFSIGSTSSTTSLSSRGGEEGVAREYIIGTPNYISIPVHNGFSPTARDDIISLLYIFLELWQKERLPWSRTVLFPTEETEKYPECHILYIQNQYKKKYKEKWENENSEHICHSFLQKIYAAKMDLNTSSSIYTQLCSELHQIQA
jgi:serine/threonine protein kinase